MKLTSPRARGLRTLQHQRLPFATRYAIDTEVWYRGFLVEREGRDPRWATKDQVQDEAIGWFLERHRRQRFDGYATRDEGGEDLTFWVDSRLMERARRMAARDGVKLARLIEAAFGTYIEQHVPARLLAFRRWIQQQACRLYRARARVKPRAAHPRRSVAAASGVRRPPSRSARSARRARPAGKRRR